MKRRAAATAAEQAQKKRRKKKTASYSGKACFRCRCKDHYSEECKLPEADTTPFQVPSLPGLDRTVALATNLNIRGEKRDEHGMPRDKSIVYCGRRLCMGGWNLPHSVLANAFYMTNDAYEQYIMHTPELRKLVALLKGQRLGCWCKPEPCHTDVLVKLANAE